MHGRIQIYKTQEKINHLMCTDDIKIFNQKISTNPVTNYKNIQSEYRNGICDCKMNQFKNEEEKKKTTERIELPNYVNMRAFGERKNTST